MGALPEPFTALGTAIDALDVFLKLQTYDFTPVVLTQPPPNRDARREYLHAAIEALDPQLTMIQQLRDRVVAAHGVLLRHRSMGYSALQPVSSLPPEVLQTIFSMVHEQTKRYYPSMALALSHVCTDWRQAARGYRNIWSSATIPGADHIAGLELPLSLCDTENFRLTVAHNAKTLAGPRDMHSLLRTLRQRLSRLVWKSSDDPDGFFHRLRPKGFGVVLSLRDLILKPTVSSDHPFAPGFIVNLKGFDFDKLSYLELSNNITLIHANDSITRNLEKLVLKDMNVALQNVRKLLEGATKLKTLSMHKVRGTLDAPSQLYPREKIDLPSLQFLDLNELEEVTTCSILQSCRFPHLRVLAVRCVQELEYSDTIGDPWHHHSSLVPDFERVTLGNSIYKAIQSAGDIVKLNLDLPHYALGAAFTAMLPAPGRTLAASPLQFISLHVSEPLSKFVGDEARSSLRAAHTTEDSNRLGRALLEALRLRASVSLPLKKLSVPSCMGDKFMFDAWSKSVTIVDCDCPANHMEWYASSDSDEDHDEDDVGDLEEDWWV